MHARPLSHQSASSKRRPAANAAVANTAGPETAEIGLGRRPRELPWLVTPAPSANQAVTTSNVAAAAGSDGGSGGGVRRGSSRSGSTESTARGGYGGWQKRQQARRSGSHADLSGPGGCSEPGEPSNASLSSLGRGWDKSSHGQAQNRGQKEEKDDCAAEAAAAERAADTEWARRQRCQALALACAGSMELPVGARSSADSGGGGGEGGETTLALSFGLGPGSIREDSPSSGGRGAGGGGNGRVALVRGQGLVRTFASIAITLAAACGGVTRS